MSPIPANQALLLVAIGATAYLAMVHLWLGRASDAASRWTGTWAAFAVAFASARLVHLNTGDPRIAIAAARVFCASSPMLIYSLFRLVQSVSGRAPSRAETRPVLAVCGATSLAALATPWFLRAETVVKLDLGDRPYLGVPAGPALPVIGVLMTIGIVWGVRELLRSPDLQPSERRGFALTLGLYAAMGLSTLLRSLGWTSWPGVAEYAPLVLASGAGHLLAIRRRRLDQALQAELTARSAALRDTEARYRDVFQNAPIGMISVDASGQLENANAALLRMLGSSHAQFASSFNLKLELNAQRSGFAAMLERALASGQEESDEFTFDSWWGRRMVTRTTVAPLHDTDGRVVGALAIVDDVTQQRAIERQLQQAQKMEAVGQLAAGIAHEINNPMAYVRANLSTLNEEVGALRKLLGPGEPPRGALERIGEIESLIAESVEGVERTVAVVRDLREFSRSGQAEHEATDVNASVENAVRLAATHRGGGQQIVERLGELPLVTGAPSQLRQLFLNLLVHALQSAGPHGVVTVSSERAGAEVRVRVHDDGPAIPGEQVARMFEPFVARRESAELSLGLYISLQIARSHGGDIGVESVAGHGTTFEVRLPAAA